MANKTVREMAAELRTFHHYEAATTMDLLFDHFGAMVEDKMFREAPLFPSAEQMRHEAQTFDPRQHEEVMW